MFQPFELNAGDKRGGRKQNIRKRKDASKYPSVDKDQRVQQSLNHVLNNINFESNERR